MKLTMDGHVVEHLRFVVFLVGCIRVLSFENELQRFVLQMPLIMSKVCSIVSQLRDDVKEGVRAALKQIGEYDKQTIRDEVRIQGPGLTDKQRDDIVNSLYSDCMFDENMKSSSRYRELNNDNVNELLKLIRKEHSEEEPWVAEYWDNDDEITICINAANFESRVGAIMTVAAKASMADKPLHIIFTVPIPVGKETLNSKRDKFFSMHLESLEDRILNIQVKH